jgi:hypothetical protein
VIHFAINATPDATSPTFTTPVEVSTNETLEAIAIATGFSNSAVGSAAYVIQPAADFMVSVNPTSLNIVAGHSGMATFTVTPENGFNSQVSFACTGLPAEASCSFNPPNVTPNGMAVSSTVTVSTIAASGAVPVSAPSFQRPIHALLFLILAMMLAVVSRRARAPRAWQPLALFLFLIAAGPLASCGGGGGGNPGTPPGTTMASVSAATGGGALKHGAELKITITQ